MEKQTVFVRRYINKSESPEKDGIYMTDAGFNRYRNHRFDLDTKWWLEEIELHSDDEILEAVLMKQDKDQTQFMRGIDFILNKLKGENN